MNVCSETHSPAARKTRVGIKTLLLATLATVLAMPTASAHKTFLASDHSVWEAGSTVEVSLTSALEFPDIQFGPAQDRIAFTSVTVGNTTINDLAFEETETALNVSFQPGEIGFSVIAMSAHPRSGEISPEDVAAYFDEIGADEDVRTAFEALPGSPAMMRSYTKHTKLFLCVATCDTGRDAAARPVGQALEFVAGSAGPRSFAILRNGEPVAGQSVEIYGTEGNHSTAVSDALGDIHIEASFAGTILLSAVWITLPDQPNGTYHSDQATLSVTLP